MASKRSVLLALASSLFLLVSHAQEQPKEEKKEELKPQRPSDSMRVFVAALAEKDAWKAEQMFISKATYEKTFPTSVPAYPEALLRCRKSIKEFIGQSLPIEKMTFVRIDYGNCPEPMLAPKGFRGLRAMCIMYDNLSVIVSIEGKLYSFKTDELIPDRDKWALMDGIRLLKPHRE